MEVKAFLRGTIEKRGKTYSIRLDLGKDPQTGRRKQKRFSGFRSKKDAENELAKIINEYNRGEYVEPKKITVAEYLHQWLNMHRKNLAVTTAHQYEEIINLHIIPAIGDIPLQKLTALHIQEFLDRELTCGRKDNKKSHSGKLSPTSVNYTYRVLRCALNRAAAIPLIARNPIIGVEPPAPAKTKPVLMTREQVHSLLAGLKGTYLYLPSYLAVYTGMRLGEILALTWDNVDLDRGAITICRTLPQQRKTEDYYFKEPKTENSVRTIAVAPSVVRTLIEVRAEHERLATECKEVWLDYGLVCCAGDGAPLHPPTVSSAFRKAARKLGFEISFHDLRDVYAGLSLVHVGESLKTISTNLGHSSGAVTLDRYTGMLTDVQRDAAKRLDKFLSGEEVLDE